MGVASFLLSIWKSNNITTTTTTSTTVNTTSSTSSSNTNTIESKTTTPIAPNMTHTKSTPSLTSLSKKRYPRSPQQVTFILSGPLYQWLEAMAVVHNYGSVHKSVRDLLAWACASQDDDLEWMFLTPHDICPYRMKYDTDVTDAVPEVTCIAGKQVHTRVSKDDPVILDARISHNLLEWIQQLISRFQLSGPSDVLEVVCKCAIELKAADDIFESHFSGRDLATSTIDLYHDLGLMRFSRCNSAQQTQT